MSSHRREVTLSPDQPILRRRHPRPKAPPLDPNRSEADFWTHFNLEKFAADWRRGVGRRKVKG